MSDKFYAIALSVMSSPAALGLWEYARNSSPLEIYRHITANRHVTTQDYLTKVYSHDPVEAAEQIIVTSDKKNIRVITCWDDDYPAILREISKPPLVLYARGDFIFGKCVSVVGTRRADNRSRDMARKVVSILADQKVTVVSGMAIGLDREAHCSALDAGGNTIGVLANGIDIPYPRSNEDLYKRILSTPGSGLVSEYPPGIYTQKWTFVRRNRIISGLSTATVVVKAALKSGSLITARYALEQNRDVFVCSGYSFDPEYAGCHKLIQEGACLVSNEDDFKSEFTENTYGAMIYTTADNVFTLPFANDRLRVIGAEDVKDAATNDGLEGAVLSHLIMGECQIDELVSVTGEGVSRINETLSMLELSGRIIRRGNLIAKI